MICYHSSGIGVSIFNTIRCYPGMETWPIAFQFGVTPASRLGYLTVCHQRGAFSCFKVAGQIQQRVSIIDHSALPSLAATALSTAAMIASGRVGACDMPASWSLCLGVTRA